VAFSCRSSPTSFRTTDGKAASASAAVWGLFLDQQIAVGVRDPDDKGVWLGLFVGGHARDQLAAMDERRSAPARSPFDVRDRASDGAHCGEGHGAELYAAHD